MTQHRIMSHRELRDEMTAVARGEKPAPEWAGTHTFESVDALMRLLTPENRQLLALIRDRKPQSIAELAETSGRAALNLTRTLVKLEAVGFIKMQDAERENPDRRGASAAGRDRSVLAERPAGNRLMIREGRCLRKGV